MFWTDFISECKMLIKRCLIYSGKFQYPYYGFENKKEDDSHRPLFNIVLHFFSN